MNYSRQLWLEKALVRAVLVVGLIVSYLLLGPVLVMGEPLAPLTFLQDGVARLGMFVGVLLGLAVLLGLLMLPARPGAALMATLLVAGGMSLPSSPIHSLLWYRGSRIPAVYLGLMGELLLLWVLGVAAWLIILAVRRQMARVRPGWVWSGEMPSVPLWQRRWGGNDAKEAGSKALASAGAFAAVSALVAMVGLLLLLQNDLRNQVAFGLVISFGAGSFIANRTVGVTSQWHALLAPLIVAIVLYALAMAGDYPANSLGWASVQVWSRPLPVDWLTFGAGGSLLGLWVSQRVAQEQALHDAAAL